MKKKISEITGKELPKKVKRNRNGKQGIDKSNGYKFIPNAERKTCYNCGNTNHIAIDCRKSKNKKTEIPGSSNRNSSVRYRPQNPCLHCGSRWHSIYTCIDYHSLYENFYDPLPKFNKSKHNDKKNTSPDKHIPVKKTNSESSDRVKSDKTNQNNSAANLNKKLSRRTQQVWVLKNSN